MFAKKLKYFTVALIAGTFAISFPMNTEAKRVHDLNVETSSEMRHHSKNDKTVNVTPKYIEVVGGEAQTILEPITPPEDFSMEFNFDVPTTVSIYDTSILGTPIATQKQCVKYLMANNPNPSLAVSAEEIVAYYYEEGQREGIRPDVAFAQALKETGFFRYGGTVTPDQNNYCGLGTTSATVKGIYFPNPQMGVRAHIQHLLAYSSTRPPTTPIVDPRYGIVRKNYGSRTLRNWYDLNGRWAVPGYSYGQEILSMFKAILGS